MSRLGHAIWQGTTHALRATLSVWFCFHDTLIQRRDKAGVMGRECARCGKWFPIAFEPSELAKQIERRVIASRKAADKRTRKEALRRESRPAVVEIRKMGA